MITIEDVRAVGEPRRPYNWELDFGDNTLKILAQECNFPVDNLLPRDVTQGNLQFSVYADRSLGILSVTLFELDSGYLVTWYNEWFTECIHEDGIVVPVGRTAREVIVKELTLMRTPNVSYKMLIVPVNEAQFSRTEGGSGPVLVQLTFQILEMKVYTPGIQTAKPIKAANAGKADRTEAAASGGYSLGPVGADGSGSFVSTEYTPPTTTSVAARETLVMPDGVIAPTTLSSFVSNSVFPTLDQITSSTDFTQFTIPPHSVEDLMNAALWSWFPGIAHMPGMNIPLPVGATINILGVDITLSFAKYRNEYPKITTSGGSYDSAGGVTTGSTFYSVDSDSPDIGTKFLGDLNSLANYLFDVSVTNLIDPIILDVGKYIDLGPLGKILPSPTDLLNDLSNYILSPTRNKASESLRNLLRSNNIDIPFQVTFR